MLQREIQDAERFRQQLVETCPDEELRTHLAALQRQHTQAQDHSLTLRQANSDCRTRAKSDLAEVANASSSRKE